MPIDAVSLVWLLPRSTRGEIVAPMGTISERKRKTLYRTDIACSVNEPHPHSLLQYYVTDGVEMASGPTTRLLIPVLATKHLVVGNILAEKVHR